MRILVRHLSTTSKKHNLKTSLSKIDSMRMCGSDITRLRTVTEGRTIEEAMEFKYSGNRISEFQKDKEHKLPTGYVE
jgi:hypothetical protein